MGASSRLGENETGPTGGPQKLIPVRGTAEQYGGRKRRMKMNLLCEKEGLSTGCFEGRGVARANS